MELRKIIETIAESGAKAVAKAVMEQIYAASYGMPTRDRDGYESMMAGLIMDSANTYKDFTVPPPMFSAKDLITSPDFTLAKAVGFVLVRNLRVPILEAGEEVIEGIEINLEDM